MPDSLSSRVRAAIDDAHRDGIDRAQVNSPPMKPRDPAQAAECEAVIDAVSQCEADRDEALRLLSAELDSGRNFGGDGDLYRSARDLLARRVPVALKENA